MKILYTKSEFENSKMQDKLPLECVHCGNQFLKNKNDICKVIKNSNFKIACKYCSKKCKYESQNKKIQVTCKNCQKQFLKNPNQIAKTVNNFCSRSCSATYNNTHKTKGNRRSKLEMWLEKQLIEIFPNLKFDFNKTNSINSELDIYIPSLKIAFELNGIFHYEPIFGKTKLNKIKNNDKRKFQACLENQIELCIIDSSSLNYFKPEKAKKYLDIICSVIQEKIKNT